jgi:hypothetical protein
MISIVHQEGSIYQVAVDDGGTLTLHEVAVWPSDVERYAPGSTPEALIEASFRFLLERESQAAILPRFELPVIERYFSDYPATIRMMIEQE